MPPALGSAQLGPPQYELTVREVDSVTVQKPCLRGETQVGTQEHIAKAFPCSIAYKVKRLKAAHINRGLAQ